MRKKKINKFDLFFLFLIIFIIVILIVVLISFSDNKTKCVLNPIDYALNDLQTKNNAQVSCTCFAYKPNSKFMIFTSQP